MLILALDDEPILLDVLIDAIAQAEPSAEIRGFGYADAALRAMREEGLRPEVVFTDIEMPGMTGLELARVMKDVSPKTNVIFVTGFSHYALEACALWPSGYVMKPVDARQISAQLDHLRFPVVRESGACIQVQCFGNFEAFSQGSPLAFRYSKSKELLAYLVDRNGASADTAELCAALWEDRRDTQAVRSQLRNLLSDLRRALRQVDAESVLVTQRNSFAIDVSQIDCDYYRFLAQEPAAVAAFAGEYMQRYTWAEPRRASLAAKLFWPSDHSH